jgi:hypothetical protein
VINKNNFCKFKKSLKFDAQFAWSIENHESNETRRLCPLLRKSYGIRLIDYFFEGDDVKGQEIMLDYYNNAIIHHE